MRKQPVHVRVRHEPSDEVIRDYAEHLFEQSGRIPGRDLENWLEAKACLEANLPRQRQQTRSQQRLSGVEGMEAYDPPIESHNLSS